MSTYRVPTGTFCPPFFGKKCSVLEGLEVGGGQIVLLSRRRTPILMQHTLVGSVTDFASFDLQVTSLVLHMLFFQAINM